MDKKVRYQLIKHTLEELEKSKEYIKNQLKNKREQNNEKEENETYDDIFNKSNNFKNDDKKIDYETILDCLTKEIDHYEKLLDENELNNKTDDNINNDNNKYNLFDDKHNNILNEDVEQYKICDFLEDYKENEKITFNKYKLNKKVIVGHTTGGNSIVINNDNFLKLFKNSDIINNSFNKSNTTNMFLVNKNRNEDKLMEDNLNSNLHMDKDYLSDMSCSTSSVISLNSFIKKEKNDRIYKNKEAYVKHKYDDNSYIYHKINYCSDCSSSSLSWHNQEYDDLFYYSNLLKEDKHLKKQININKNKNKNLTKDNNKKHITDNHNCYNDGTYNLELFKNKPQNHNASPFFKYIYFKYINKDKNNFYPVFINHKNGKKKIWNLKSLNKYHHVDTTQTNNKYELDTQLFSYKSHKYLSSVHDNSKKIKKKSSSKNVQNIDSLKKYRFDVDEMNYSIDKIVHQIEQIHNIEKSDKKKTNYNEHFLNFIKKNKEYLKKENNFTFKKLCETEKIKLKVKIIGTDGKIIKNRSLDNVVINKNKTFGDLALKLGHTFKLSDDKIENIKMFFDGDLCDKNMSFDNNELGLEDGYQIDVKFPLTDDIPCTVDESNLSDDSYILFLPDSYVID
ncbi:hypothetical protein CYL21_2002 [Plasmodium falciparum NF54]|uniref:Uncharacterized protein n=3 Tax=Plasmodium falciparum TaxID=5833 RepID=C0H5C1_PLAF7|nr:conserved Plasmodium protein, unknown function [Plasmodium falciparum 3D7]KAF4329860.1 hypothetical protein CYL21_2002 [Plasmodium falciparum NF54]PKC47100.1 hypothetical protein CK202_2728 [Plasmodium falciparum NF54]CAX64299.1 conserved Plasmodium protein, unknown function [Plasmodium falciparum 3D7]|eukprot:XP_002809018.1 conserved Plasmodium protein, unknown function [Plasmodium falciparum 3D7]